MSVKISRLAELNNIIENPEFWDDYSSAGVILKEQFKVGKIVHKWITLISELDIISELYVNLESMDKYELRYLVSQILEIEERFNSFEELMLINPEDSYDDAIVSINAGSGGLEAQEWASMLFIMYLRWAQKKGFQVILYNKIDNDNNGIKSAEFSISGENVYGLLKSEIGVHRLIRISPFDEAKSRHTSFASVNVIPNAKDDLGIELIKSDLIIETFRGTGPGGQHKNKVETAVRITHVPTNITAQCQSERSQGQNKSHAMEFLYSKVKDYYIKLEKAEAQKSYDSMTSISWGHQIRSYVLHPNMMVKDHRTDHFEGDTNSVLNGNLDGFIKSFLYHSFNKLVD